MDTCDVLSRSTLEPASATPWPISMARNGQREEAEALLHAAIARAKNDAEHFEDPRLSEATQNLERLVEDLPAAAAQEHREANAGSTKNRSAHSSAGSCAH